MNKLIVLMAILLSGCSKTVKINIEIQQDGSPYLIPFQEYNDTTILSEYDYYNITEDDLLKDLKYFSGRFEDEYASPGIEIKDYIDFINSHGGIVSGAQYPYILVIPITADREIKPKKTSGQKRLNLERCNGKNSIEWESNIGILKSENPEIIDGLYHYKLYANYNAAASKMLLNNISDLCLSYYDHHGRTAGVELNEDSYITESNKLVIPSKEFEDALDYWNIPYDLQ
jgi:hypothetical protein